MTRQELPRGEEPRSPTPRPDPAVAWSVTLHVLAFPWIAVMFVVMAIVASSMGIQIGSAQEVGTQRLLVSAFIVISIAPLVGSAVIGLRGWRKRRRRGALVTGWVSIAAIVLFVLIAATLL